MKNWNNQEMAREVEDAFEKFAKANVGYEKIARKLGVALHTVFRWKKKTSFPRKKCAEELIHLAENLSEVGNFMSSGPEVFSAWLGLKPELRKKLLAAMNAYESS